MDREPLDISSLGLDPHGGWCSGAVVREPERLKLTLQQQLGWSGDAVVTKLDLQ